MTREEAASLVQAFIRGAAGMERPGLNDKGFGGILFPSKSGAAQTFFEYDSEQKALICRAHLFTFTPEEPTSQELQYFSDEERAGAPSGGGKLEYMPENKGLYLTRTYRESTPHTAFVDDMMKLAEASLHWRDQVVDRVYDRIQGRSTP